LLTGPQEQIRFKNQQENSRFNVFTSKQLFKPEPLETL